MLTDQELPTFTSISSFEASSGINVSANIKSYNISSFKSRYYLKSQFSDFNNDHLSFYKTLVGKSQINIPSGIIPPGLLYCSEKILIFERPPALKTIQWTPQMLDNIDDDTEYATFEIPVPWQVYFVHFTKTSDNYHVINKIFLTFSNTPIYSLNQPLYLPPLTNVYTNGQVCQPHYSHYDDLIEGTETIAGIMQNAYNQVWSSSMNVDLTSAPLKLLKHFALPGLRIHNQRCMIEPTIKSYANTVAHKMRHVPTIDCFGYYTNPQTVHSFYRSWETISLNDICDMEWSPSDKKINDDSIYRRIQNLSTDSSFIEYMTANGHISSSHNDNTECCEECQYFDEDGDLIEEICSEEGYCSCHDSNNINIPAYDEHGNSVLYRYLQDVNFSFDSPLTFSELFGSFLEDIQPNPLSNNSINSYISRSLNNSLSKSF